MPEITLAIGGLHFHLEYPSEVMRDKEIEPFLLEDAGTPDVTVRYQLDSSISKWKIVSSPDAVTVCCNPRLKKHLTALRGCLMYLPMEQILLAHNRFFLHASFVTSPWGGLLFTGDSGAGKSTQAELWREHMGSTIINGDRAIVAKEEKGWRAYGSPYAGSSGYYVLRDEPVRAIVLLKQAKDNQVSDVSDAEAFCRLMLQISVDYSRTNDVEHLSDLVMELIRSVPVYQLYCTPDARSVHVLTEALRKEKTDG